MLRDRLVFGIADERRLLGEKELPFPRALEIARAMQTAGRNTEEIKTTKVVGAASMSEAQQVSTDVHQMQAEGGTKCYQCGEKGHLPSQCGCKEFQCFVSKKVGHIGKACRAKGHGRGVGRGTTTKQFSQPTHQIEREEDEPDKMELDLKTIYVYDEHNQGGTIEDVCIGQRTTYRDGN